MLPIHKRMRLQWSAQAPTAQRRPGYKDFRGSIACHCQNQAMPNLKAANPGSGIQLLLISSCWAFWMRLKTHHDSIRHEPFQVVTQNKMSIAADWPISAACHPVLKHVWSDVSKEGYMWLTANHHCIDNQLQHKSWSIHRAGIPSSLQQKTNIIPAGWCIEEVWDARLTAAYTSK